MSDAIIHGLVMAIVAATTLLALLTAPAYHDSMTYHLARVSHWLAQGSLEHYSTVITRQLQFSPFASLLYLHSIGLSGSDLAVKTYSLLAYIGTAWLAYRLARELGASKSASRAAAVFCISLPIGLLEASTTQIDLIVAYPLMGATFLLLRQLNSGFSIWRTLSIGAFCAVAIYTKGTAYLFGLGLLPLFVFVCWRTQWRVSFALVLSIVCLSALVNGPFLARNHSIAQQIAASDVESPNKLGVVDQIGARGVASNALRLGGSALYSVLNPANQLVYNSVGEAHRLLRLSPSDPRYTFPSTEWGYGVAGKTGLVASAGLRDSMAGYPLHATVLALACLAWVRTLRRATRRTVAYAIGGTLAFVAFIVLLKWQPWITRLTIPGLLLAAPIVALGFEQAKLPRHWFSAAQILLLLCALPLALVNPLRPLLPVPFDMPEGSRKAAVLPGDRHLRAYNADFHEGLINALRFLPSSRENRIGLVIGLDSPEYPVWVIGRKTLSPAVRFLHLCPAARGGIEIGTSPALRYALAFDVEMHAHFTCHGNHWAQVFRSGSVAVLQLQE